MGFAACRSMRNKCLWVHPSSLGYFVTAASTNSYRHVGSLSPLQICSALGPCPLILFFQGLKKKNQKAKIYWVVLFLSSSPSPFLGISSFWQSTEFELKEMQHVSKFCVTWLQNQPSWLRMEALTPSKAVWLTYLFAYRAKMERKKKSRKRSESAQTPYWSWISREPEMRVLMHIPWAYHDYYF